MRWIAGLLLPILFQVFPPAVRGEEAGVPTKKAEAGIRPEDLPMIRNLELLQLLDLLQDIDLLQEDGKGSVAEERQ